MAAAETIRFVYSEITKLLKNSGEARKENAKRLFDAVVEPSFHQLAMVHSDYMKNLSVLKEHLERKDLPPNDVLHWLHEAGLKYNTDRAFLRTIEVELKGVDYRKLVGKDMMAELQAAFEGYCRSIVQYWYTSNAPNEWSSYTDFELHLEMVLNSLDAGAARPISLKDLGDLFHHSKEVQKVLTSLSEVCSARLPKRWAEVCL